MAHGPHQILPAGTWPAEAEQDQILLDPGGHRSGRAMIQTLGGRALLIDLEHIDQVRPGDGIALPEGGVVRIHLAPEALIEIRAENAGQLARLAWRLGNGHLPIESGPDWLRLRPGRLASEILAGQQTGIQTRQIRAIFTADQPPSHGGHTHSHAHE